MIANTHVMRDVNTLHDEVTVTYNRLTRRKSCTIYHHILSDDVVVANHQLRFITDILKVLRNCSQNGTLMHRIVLTHTSTVHHTDKRINGTSFTNHNIAFDIGKRHNRNVVPDLCSGVDECLGMNILRHNVSYF